MQIIDNVVNERRVQAVLSEKEIFDILIQHVEKETHFNVYADSEVRVVLDQKDKAGTAGFEYTARITLVNALNKPKKEK